MDVERELYRWSTEGVLQSAQEFFEREKMTRWQSTDQARWLEENRTHVVDIRIEHNTNLHSWDTTYRVIATMDERDYVAYVLRWA